MDISSLDKIHELVLYLQIQVSDLRSMLSRTIAQHFRIPVPIDSSSTFADHRLGFPFACFPTSLSNFPSSVKRCTCIVSLRCENNQSTLPSSPTCRMFSWSISPSTKLLAVFFRSFKPGISSAASRIWLGNSHRPASNPFSGRRCMRYCPSDSRRMAQTRVCS